MAKANGKIVKSSNKTIKTNSKKDIINATAYSFLKEYINKIEILKELNESNIDNCTFINIVNFSDEVILDVNISKPTFQAKKNAELTINKFFSSESLSSFKVKINFKNVGSKKNL